MDTTSGLYYLRARQYDTVLGRFTQEDTYLGDGRNLYVYVRNNPLKYVDPSGYCSKSIGYEYGYFYRPLMPREIVEYQKQKEEAEKEAKRNLIAGGSYDVLKGTMEAVSGTVVTLASISIMQVHPLIGWSGATTGSSYANMGISNASEGFQKIYNGITGNVDASTFNATRDTFFLGNQEYYNQAEAILGSANFIYGVGLPNLSTGLPSGGNIMEYANAGSQMTDFLETVEDAVEGGNNALSGQWQRVNESMSDFSRAYQAQITGQEGMAWVQNGVKFDGMTNGVLLEAKGEYAQFIDRTTGEFYSWFSGKTRFY